MGGGTRREQDRPGTDRGQIQLCAHPSCPLPFPEVLGDTDIPIWTLAQSSVAMATRWALWWEEEGSGCMEISIGGSSSAFCCGGIGISERWEDIPSAISGDHGEGGFRAATPASELLLYHREELGSFMERQLPWEPSRGVSPSITSSPGSFLFIFLVNVFICLFIHSVNKYVLRTYYVRC